MTISLMFCGAAGTVTGSCFLLDTGKRKVLVDCGMFQGSKTERQLNYEPFPFDAESLDAVLLTHAHIDHSGLLPKLTKAGFTGPIHATPATGDLCSVMLPDSAHIQEYEVEIHNRRNRQRGRPEVTPIYTGTDVEACLEQFRPTGYESWFEVTDDVRARFWNAGHLLGSASIEVEVSDPSADGGRLSILFSGDIGPDFKLLHPDPEAPAGFDYVVCESTYGPTDRHDRSPGRRRLHLASEVNRAAKRGGALIIPSFAVERTQELVTDLVRLMGDGEIPETRIFIDSPLANRASDVFIRHADELENGADLLRAFRSDLLRFSHSVDESKAINRLRGFFIVIAASGMCDAGRIRHHLKNRLWREDATVLMVGYQAEGTLGRLLVKGVSPVRIHGEEIAVNAAIRSIDDYSGHADGPELADWLEERKPVRAGVFLVHGEPEAREALKQCIEGGVLPAERIYSPAIDDIYLLGPDSAEPSDGRKRRIAPEATARLDWNNELTELILDINDVVEKAPGEKARGVIIRRLRRALDDEGEKRK
jgi:metallo-beta-lactamase family protein